MVDARSMVLAVTVCADTTDQHLVRQVRVPVRDEPGAPGRGEHPPACPFSSLSALGLAAETPAPFAAALAFALVLGLAALRLPTPRRWVRLRPPLRGPPVLA
ncbi:MAG TPA: hypothetical protein VN627_08530 [Novosphingobium sp.]|jgi:hypothetical protein|nr:hypothetical protein [Novosphingobium sp.]